MKGNELVRERLRERGQAVEAYLSGCLKDRPMPPRLRKAMEYSLCAGGKRLRPVLCLTTALLGGERLERVMPFAAGIEMIHTYSLIHDDLPAMDDDDMRRGRPSNHKAFDEATAILAGDALLTDAFVFMTVPAGGHDPVPADRVLAALAEMAVAAGSAGMVGGQVLDMDYTGARLEQGVKVTLADLRAMHRGKTGALFRASCVAGGLLAGAAPAVIAALRTYGEALGAAFQIVDDVLDVTADSATLGKPAGSDARQGKVTYPSLVGLDESRAMACAEAGRAVDALGELDGDEATFLRELAQVLLDRIC